VRHDSNMILFWCKRVALAVRRGTRGDAMRLLGLLTGIFVVVLSGGAHAQPWVSYSSLEDRFAIWFPSEPDIENIEWIDEHSEARPARRYSAERNGDIFTVIAVDYAGAEWDLIRAAYPHAATVYRQKGTVTYDGWAHTDRIDGHRLQITLDDGRRIYFVAHMHDEILYILDANVSPRSPPPGRFEQGLQILDREGQRVRYDLQGERVSRTDDLHDALGGADLDGPIPLGQGDLLFGQ
jgi:hypothetical protein